jgi:hypothetical protein
MRYRLGNYKISNNISSEGDTITTILTEGEVFLLERQSYELVDLGDIYEHYNYNLKLHPDTTLKRLLLKDFSEASFYTLKDKSFEINQELHFVGPHSRDELDYYFNDSKNNIVGIDVLLKNRTPFTLIKDTDGCSYLIKDKHD